MRLILLLFLIPFAFAQPSIENIMDNNTDTGQGLDGWYNASLAKNSSFIVSFGNITDINISVSASMEIAGMNLLLDNMTYPADDLAVIVARGYDQGHLISKHEDGYPDFICDYDWFQGGAQYAQRCDFEPDNCAEFENRTSVSYDAVVFFTFRNVTGNVTMGPNVIEVPEEVLDEMRTSSGMEHLHVNITGDVVFSYEFNDRGFFGFDCTSSYFNQTVPIPFSLNRSFLVAGQQKLFFLKSPVLQEQWFRNNRFDVLVLSQSPLYLANISMNGNTSTSHTLREFNTTTDRFGLKQIVSNLTEPDGWSESRSLTTPIPLQEHDYSYSFIYLFNHSYQGLGENTLALAVVDSFMGSADFERALLSRMLTFDGDKTETGAPLDPEVSRKSSGFEEGELSGLQISLGFLALILILAFVNFWLR